MRDCRGGRKGRWKLQRVRDRGSVVIATFEAIIRVEAWAKANIIVMIRSRIEIATKAAFGIAAEATTAIVAITIVMAMIRV